MTTQSYIFLLCIRIFFTFTFFVFSIASLSWQNSCRSPEWRYWTHALLLQGYSRPRLKRVNMRDLNFVLEEDRESSKSSTLYKSFLRWFFIPWLQAATTKYHSGSHDDQGHLPTFMQGIYGGINFGSYATNGLLFWEETTLGKWRWSAVRNRFIQTCVRI